MNREQEQFKKVESQEVQQTPEATQESPENMREQMVTTSQQEVADFQREGTAELARDEVRAEKEGLQIESADKEELRGLSNESSIIREEFVAEINGELVVSEENAAAESKVERANITGVIKDKNFEGSQVIQTEDAEGRIAGYALRKNSRGDLEGNKIGYMKDGSVAWTQQLHKSDFEKLYKNGVMEKYESALIDEKNSTTQERTIENPELLETKDASKKLLAEERSEIAREFWEQRRNQRERLSKLKGVIDVAQEKIQGEKGDEQVGRIAALQANEANMMAERISTEEMTEEAAQEEKEAILVLIDSGDATNSLKKKLEQHYAKADSEAKKKFETVRKNVDQVLMRNDAFIVHALLTDERNRHNDNSNISKRATLIDDIDILLSFEPSISTSSVKRGSEQGLWEEGVGFLIGGGEVMGGEQGDNNTQTGGLKYRNGTKLNSQQIDALVSDPRKRNYNELVVNNPKVFGFFQAAYYDDEGRLKARSYNDSKIRPDLFLKFMEIAEQKGLPKLIMTPDRHVYEFVSVDEKGIITIGREITPEEVANGNVGLSNGHRKKLGEEVISKNLFKSLKDQQEAKGIIAELSGNEEDVQKAQLSNEEYLQWLKDNGSGNFLQLPEKLYSNKDFMLEAAHLDPVSAYSNSSEELRSDIDYIKKLYALGNGKDVRIFQFMPENLRTNLELVERAIENGDFQFLNVSIAENPQLWEKILDRMVRQVHPEGTEIGSAYYCEPNPEIYSEGKKISFTERIMTDPLFMEKLQQTYPNFVFENYKNSNLRVERIS